MAPRDASLATRLLLACGIAGPVVFWALGWAAGWTWPGYDPVTESISVLAQAPNGWLQVIAFVLIAVLTAGFAVGMGRTAGVTATARAQVRSALLALAAIELGFALFPTDPPGAATTPLGAAHMLVFATWSIAFPILAWRIAGPLRDDPPWRRAGTLTIAVAAAMGLALVVVALTLAGPLAPWTGLLERLYVAVPSLWLAGLATHGLLVTAGRLGS